MVTPGYKHIWLSHNRTPSGWMWKWNHHWKAENLYIQALERKMCCYQSFRGNLNEVDSEILWEAFESGKPGCAWLNVPKYFRIHQEYNHILHKVPEWLVTSNDIPGDMCNIEQLFPSFFVINSLSKAIISSLLRNPIYHPHTIDWCHYVTVVNWNLAHMFYFIQLARYSRSNHMWR